MRWPDLEKLDEAENRLCPSCDQRLGGRFEED
jgi:hypothetical protein